MIYHNMTINHKCIICYYKKKFKIKNMLASSFVAISIPTPGRYDKGFF